MVVFRENTEDVYAGFELKEGTRGGAGAHRRCSASSFGWTDPRGLGHRDQAGEPHRLGASGARRAPVCRLPRQEERHARAQGQHPEVHRGRVPRVGLRAGAARVRRHVFIPPESSEPVPMPAGKVLVKDAIADNFLQQILSRPCGVRRHRHDESQRGLHLRRAGGAGGRHRHRPGGEHQLRHRARAVRGHARHGAEIRRQGHGKPVLGDPFRCHDAGLHRVGRGGSRSSRRR